MPRSVGESWDSIVDWLDRNSPPVAALIRPPAAEQDIRAAERSVGTALPDDLVAWWRRADGLDNLGSLLPPSFSPYPVREALESRDIWLKIRNEEQWSPDLAAYIAQEDSAPAGSPCRGVWLPRWLPIAREGGGDDLFVDLRPGPAHGCVRVFRHDDDAVDEALWSGVAPMLAEIADALRHGTAIRGDQVWVEDDGEFTWESDADRWVSWGSRSVDVARLRDGYASLVAALRAGTFGPPPAGSWSAEWIAAHVVRNTELLIATTERASAAGAEYDNSDAMDPATIERYAASGLAALADQISRLGARLCDLAEPLNQVRPVVRIHIVDSGRTIVAREVGWLGVLNALWVRQLSLCSRQLHALR